MADTNDRVEINEAMVDAAREAGKAAGLWPTNPRYKDISRILSAALSKMPTPIIAPRYDMLISTTIDKKKARFLGPTNSRGYFHVETEDGKPLIVHANEILGPAK